MNCAYPFGLRPLEILIRQASYPSVSFLRIFRKTEDFASTPGCVVCSAAVHTALSRHAFHLYLKLDARTLFVRFQEKSEHSCPGPGPKFLKAIATVQVVRFCRTTFALSCERIAVRQAHEFFRSSAEIELLISDRIHCSNACDTSWFVFALYSLSNSR